MWDFENVDNLSLNSSECFVNDEMTIKIFTRFRFLTDLTIFNIIGKIVPSLYFFDSVDCYFYHNGVSRVLVLLMFTNSFSNILISFYKK